jgi:hypothetical protein
MEVILILEITNAIIEDFNTFFTLNGVHLSKTNIFNNLLLIILMI